jgi:hypothetical protein
MFAGAVSVVAAWWQLHATTLESEAPEALWRNGVIVDVRHCDQPTSEAANLRCAALICAQRVTRQLTNAQQTRLTLTSYGRDEATGQIKVEGTLAQTLSSPTLPTRFHCQSATPAAATPTLEYAKQVRGAP